MGELGPAICWPIPARLWPGRRAFILWPVNRQPRGPAMFSGAPRIDSGGPALLCAETLGRIGFAHVGDGLLTQGAEHDHVDPVEAAEIEATAAGAVLAEPGQQVRRVPEPAHDVEDQVRLARREADDRPVAGRAPVAAEADDRRAPHDGLLAGDLAH